MPRNRKNSTDFDLGQYLARELVAGWDSASDEEWIEFLLLEGQGTIKVCMATMVVPDELAVPLLNWQKAHQELEQIEEKPRLIGPPAKPLLRKHRFRRRICRGTN